MESKLGKLHVCMMLTWRAWSSRRSSRSGVSPTVWDEMGASGVSAEIPQMAQILSSKQNPQSTGMLKLYSTTIFHT